MAEQHHEAMRVQAEQFQVVTFDEPPFSINIVPQLPDDDTGDGIQSLAGDSLMVPVTMSSSTSGTPPSWRCGTRRTLPRATGTQLLPAGMLRQRKARRPPRSGERTTRQQAEEHVTSHGCEAL